jgi:hypothetical protein
MEDLKIVELFRSARGKVFMTSWALPSHGTMK